MPTAAAQPPAVSPSQSPVNESTGAKVAIGIDELIVGRPLESPVCDDRGVLLLATGTVITSDVKRLLRERGMSQIELPASEAGKLRLLPSIIVPTSSLSFDGELAKQLDGVIDSGMLLVQNRGPAVRDRRVQHGRKGYDTGKQQAVAELNQATNDALASTLRDALHGGAVSGTAVTGLAARHLAEMADDTDCVISTAVQATSDQELADHALKTSMLGMAIGVEMGFDDDNCRKLCVAGLMHDLGMYRVPVELRKAERILTQDEYYEIRKHPLYTAEILERTHSLPSMVNVIAYQVHERPNGRGYPRGRTGERIHSLARILAVADTYAALISPRPFRPALAPYAAMETLIRLAATRDLDPEMVRAFLRVMGLFPIASLVTLDDGSVAQVLRRNGDQYSTPIVRVLQTATGEQPAADDDSAVVDLATGDRKVVQALPMPGKNELMSAGEFLHLQRPRR